MDKTLILLIANYLQLSDLKKILDDYDMSSSGIKLDLISRIVDNLELAFDEVLEYFTKEKIKKICSDLCLKTTGSREDLIELILTHVKEYPDSIINIFKEEDEPIDYISIFDRYFTVAETKEMARNYDLPISGNKSDIVERILKFAKPTYEELLEYLDKEQLKILADELEIEYEGLRLTRDDLIIKNAKKIKYNLGKNKNKENQNGIEIENNTIDIIENIDIKNPEIVSASTETTFEKKQIKPNFQVIRNFLENFRPADFYKKSNDHKIELATALRYHFGSHNVRMEKQINSGNIDIDIFGIGIEVKNSSNLNRGELDRMMTQLNRYKKHYGDNLVLELLRNSTLV